MVPPYLGAINNTNTLFVQQPPIIALGGLIHNYSNQTIYPQPYTSFTQNQTTYPQSSIHIPQPQNYNM